MCSPGAIDSVVPMARSSIPGLLISLIVLLAGLLFAFTVGRYPVGISDLFSVILRLPVLSFTIVLCSSSCFSLFVC